MELDLRYSQYNYGNNVVEDKKETQTNEQEQKIRPNQQVYDFLAPHQEAFSKSAIKAVLTSSADGAEVVLDNGTIVLINNQEGVINLNVRYANGSGFIGFYFDKNDKETIKKILPHLG